MQTGQLLRLGFILTLTVYLVCFSSFAIPSISLKTKIIICFTLASLISFQSITNVIIGLMGGGDSRVEEQENKDKVAEGKIASKSNSNSPSPRLKNTDNMQMTVNRNKSIDNHYKEAQLNPYNDDNQQSYIGTKDCIGSPQVADGPEYFSSWDSKFHKNDKLELKIHILVIEPTFHMKNLKKKESQYFAQLSWEYQYLNKNGKKTFLRFNLAQDGGYNINFLMNEEGDCVEGNQTIWNVICPFRMLEEVKTVGGFNCQRIYESNQSKAEEQQQEGLEAQTYKKWGEKPIVNRAAMRKLLSKRREIQKLKSEKGFEYSQATKYFTTKDDWMFSVLIEEKFNTFKSWIVELDCGSDKKQAQKNSMMSATLKNDVETRQTMYIEQMKRKKNIFQQSNLQKLR